MAAERCNNRRHVQTLKASEHSDAVIHELDSRLLILLLVDQSRGAGHWPRFVRIDAVL